MLINKWKLIKMDAMDKIRSSPMYLIADDETAKKFDEQAKLILDSVYYDFRKDNFLIYVDLENNKPIRRRAKWSLDKDVLSINEIDRIYSRRAKIIKLTDKELIISPIVDGEIMDSKMIFKAQSTNSR